MALVSTGKLQSPFLPVELLPIPLLSRDPLHGRGVHCPFLVHSSTLSSLCALLSTLFLTQFMIHPFCSQWSLFCCWSCLQSTQFQFLYLLVLEFVVFVFQSRPLLGIQSSVFHQTRSAAGPPWGSCPAVSPQRHFLLLSVRRWAGPC